ncbi:MAG: lytic transglycosylase domain-containing protein [Actinobacteria bacterium]|nr:lytic transglycosylase domain-containing protein [Actinomycetota bacterium]
MRRILAVLLVVGLAVGLVGIWAVRTEPGWYVQLRYPLDYEWIIDAHADNYELSPALVAAVIYSESGFDPTAESPAGAIGLMQLLPETAQGIADRTGGGGFVADDLYDPEINVRYGCWYLRHLQEKYADHPQSLDLALAAYNAGQGNVDGWVDATPAGEPVAIRFAETRAYIRKVRHLQELYRDGYGLR